MASISAEVSFIEIGVSDASKSSAFLEQMFGWKFHPFGPGGQGWFQTPSLKAGLHGGDPNWGFLVYFAVPDLAVAITEVNRLGGTTEAPTEEAEFGKFCTCRDPQGLRFGLHQR